MTPRFVFNVVGALVGVKLMTRSLMNAGRELERQEHLEPHPKIERRCKCGSLIVNGLCARATAEFEALEL